MLSSDEIEHYRREGYVIPRARFEGAELERLQRQIYKVVADNPELTNKPLPMVHVPRGKESGLASDGSLMEFAAHPRVLDMVEQLAGPDLILWQTTIFHKPAETGVDTPWHQDAIYWPITPEATTSIWVAVSDSKRDNGCLRVLPMSKLGRRPVAHAAGNSSGPFSKAIDPASFNEGDAVDIELEAGQFVLLDCQIVHGAQPNVGTRSRTGFAVRYMPSTSFYDHEHDRAKRRDGALAEHLVNVYAKQPLFLVRGVNRNPRTDLNRNHPMGA